MNGYTGEGYIILNDRGTGAWMINGGLYGGALRLVLLGLLTISLVPYAGPFLSYHLVAVSVGFVSAGLALIEGKRHICYAIMLATIHIFKEAFLKISLKRLFGKSTYEMLSFFSIPSRLFGANRLAKELCLCNIEPKCGL